MEKSYKMQQIFYTYSRPWRVLNLWRWTTSLFIDRNPMFPKISAEHDTYFSCLTPTFIFDKNFRNPSSHLAFGPATSSFYRLKTCAFLQLSDSHMSANMITTKANFSVELTNSQILLKISVIPILLNFIYLVALNLLVNNPQPTQLNSWLRHMIVKMVVEFHNIELWKFKRTPFCSL